MSGYATASTAMPHPQVLPYDQPPRWQPHPNAGGSSSVQTWRDPGPASSGTPRGRQQALALVLSPEIVAAKRAPTSPWFDLARRLASEEVYPDALATLFDDALLRDFDLSPSDSWFVFARRCLGIASPSGHARDCGDATRRPAAGCHEVPSTPRAETPRRDEPAQAAPPAIRAQPLALSHPAEAHPAPETRMLRLLPEVRHSTTATSPEGIIDAVFAHLLGRAAA